MNHVNRLIIHYCFLKFPLNLSVHLPLRCLLATGRLAIVAWIRGRLNSSLSAKAMAAHVKAIEDSSVVLLTSGPIGPTTKKL